LLGCVLALDGADLSTLGAVAGRLEHTLRIHNTEIGLLASVVSISAAAATIPIGVLSDRVSRVRLLTASVALWTVAMAVGGAAGSYGVLLGSRIFLGAIQATAGPTLVSLVGDFFPVGERARMNGYIVSGELLGGGVGFLSSGEIAAALSWRWAFWMLTVPGVALALALWRLLDEPPRGQQGRLATSGDGGRRRGRGGRNRDTRGRGGRGGGGRVLGEDPVRMPLRRAVRYVLSVRTNVIVIAASALGTYFFAGVRTFAQIYVRGHFGLTQAASTAVLGVIGLGALAGILAGGRVADALIRRGRTEARMSVAGWSYVVVPALFVVPIITTSLVAALPLFMVAAAALTAPSAPLDAVRLDVVPAVLWGRAEGVRTVLRTLAVGLAPLVFGWIADIIAKPGPHDLAAIGATAVNGQALELTFLVMLAPVLASGIVLLRGRGAYAHDIAAADASEKRWTST
jgi:predicted MFS family arabinose efflux permease